MIAHLNAIMNVVDKMIGELLPKGLCGNRDDHDPHIHHSSSLGPLWCTAEQSQREPGRSERKLREDHA